MTRNRPVVEGSLSPTDPKSVDGPTHTERRDSCLNGFVMFLCLLFVRCFGVRNV